MAAIEEAQREGEELMSGLALRAIAYADVVMRSLKKLGSSAGPNRPLGEHLDRLPFTAACDRLQAGRSGTITSFWLEIIESWVIGSTSDVRLRAMTTEHSVFALRSRHWLDVTAQ